jgi:hypothetical protein
MRWPFVETASIPGNEGRGVNAGYDGMVRIVVTPTWAKLIDFETTLPSAVEELVKQRAEKISRRISRRDVENAHAAASQR